MNAVINRTTRVINLGIADYPKAWDFQTALFRSILDVKSENRSLPPEDQKPTDNFLIFCEHPHVYTLGRNGAESNLLLKAGELHTIQATYYQTNRGGDITYHGPGQIVVYPVIDLENFFTDIHRYMRLLEESVMETLLEFNVPSGRIPGLTGVWCGIEDEPSARKIAAMGVKTSRWVTMHGLALNVGPDLSYFKNIIACGIPDKAVTSLDRELGSPQNPAEVSAVLEKKIGTLFGMELVH